MGRTVEQIRESKRLYMAKRRAENPDAMREYQRDLHHRRRDANCQKMRQYYARRFFWGKAMKLQGEGRATAKELAKLWKNQRGKCALTGRRLDRTAQLDHKQPRARGGSDQMINLQWLCEEANLAKRALTDDEFIDLCRDVMRWIGERISLIDSLAYDLSLPHT